MVISSKKFWTFTLIGLLISPNVFQNAVETTFCSSNEISFTPNRAKSTFLVRVIISEYGRLLTTMLVIRAVIVAVSLGLLSVVKGIRALK